MMRLAVNNIEYVKIYYHNTIPYRGVVVLKDKTKIPAYEEGEYLDLGKKTLKKSVLNFINKCDGKERNYCGCGYVTEKYTLNFIY